LRPISIDTRSTSFELILRTIFAFGQALYQTVDLLPRMRYDLRENQRVFR